MPIHFYCVYCDKQLGIATRKAGQVVTCPNCSKQIRVPEPTEAEPPPARSAVPTVPEPRPAAVGNLFEQSNFDDVLRPSPSASPRQAPVAVAPPVVSMAFDLPKPEPAAALPAVRLASPAPAAMPLPAQAGIYLSPTRATALLVLVVFLIAGAFITGLIVGRVLGGE